MIGTRSGDLYESSLESNGKERPFSLVYSLSRRQPRAGDGTGGGGGGGSGSGGGGGGPAGGGRGGDGGVVAALYLESMSSAVHGETRVFVMAVTASPLRLYVFMGGPTLEVKVLVQGGRARARGEGGGRLKRETFFFRRCKYRSVVVFLNADDVEDVGYL